MSSLERVVLGLVLAFVVVTFYSLKYANLVLLRDGCNGALAGLPMNGTVHFKAFPPHYFCQYRTRDGRLVERSH